MSKKATSIVVVPVKLVDGAIILGCVCGAAVKYPGHPPTRNYTECERCGRVYVERRTDS